MRLRSVWHFSAVMALLLAAGAFGAAPKATPAETTYVKVICKVFVTELGLPKSVEVLAVEPSLDPSTRAVFEKSASEVVMTWEFTPTQENGKPVAGFVVVPVIIDLADPVPTSGT